MSKNGFAWMLGCDVDGGDVKTMGLEEHSEGRWEGRRETRREAECEVEKQACESEASLEIEGDEPFIAGAPRLSSCC